MGSSLPSKEQSLFRQLVRQYETKQYKKALRCAETILKKFPQHGETLAMKGLVLNALDMKTEAYEYVKKGLRYDLKSHVCWHVYGLLYRSDREYVEASRAYLQALRIDTDNVQILRDLALLQIQTRHFEGFSNTRRTLLGLKPGQKNNWIAFALSHHLQNNYEEALRVLDTYQETTDYSGDSGSSYEMGELQLYKNSILEESGNYGAALSHLESIGGSVVDRGAWLEAKARLLLNLKRYEDAADTAVLLMDRNAENATYFDNYRRAVLGRDGVADELSERRAVELCDELAKKYPKALLPRRLPLDLLSSGDDDFTTRLDAYVRWFLLRGVPSLNTDLKSLYKNESKVAAIEALFLEFEKTLREDKTMPQLATEKTPMEASPATLFWVLYFLAQHYDRKGDLEKALEYVDASIEHTPTVIEAYQMKGRILKHLGDYSEAAKIADDARRMDLADRNLNTKCAKYNMRANKVSEAEANIALFTREGDSRGVQALYDMQCMWYECEAAESFMRQKQYAPALKRFVAVTRHFDDFVEDQFDFHTYCIRKETMRSYVRLLRMEDRVHSSRFFVRAAKGLVRLYVQLHLNPDVKDGTSELSEAMTSLSTADRKKALSKKRKEQAKKQQAQSDKKKDKNGKAGEGKKDGKKGGKKSGGEGTGDGWMEVDPNGEELLKAVKDPLGEAVKLQRELEKYAVGDCETQQLAYEVALLRKKYLLALRAVRRMFKIDSKCDTALVLCARLIRDVEQNDEVQKSLSPAVKEVLGAEGSTQLLDGKSLREYCELCAKDEPDDVKVRLGAGLALLYSADEDGNREEAMKLLTDLNGRIDTKTCERVKDELERMRAEEAVAAFKKAAAARFPRANTFA